MARLVAHPPGDALALRLRRAEPDDMQLFDPSTRPSDTADLVDLVNSKNLIDAGFETCYVALTRNDEVCYLQFMIDSSHPGARSARTGTRCQVARCVG